MEWSEVKWDNIASIIPSPRHYHSSIVHEGKIVIFGGNGSEVDLDLPNQARTYGDMHSFDTGNVFVLLRYTRDYQETIYRYIFSTVLSYLSS